MERKEESSEIVGEAILVLTQTDTQTDQLTQRGATKASYKQQQTYLAQQLETITLF